MRTAEKKYRNQESSNLPSSIGDWVKILGSALGFYLWGVEFIWVILGWGIICKVFKIVASLGFSLIIIAGLISFISKLLS